MQAQSNISNFIHENYSNYLEFIKENFPMNNNVITVDFYEVFLLRILPRIKFVKDKNENYRIIKDELLLHFSKEQLNTKDIQAFSDKLFNLNYEVNRDHRSENLNKIHRIIGILLITVNIIYIAILSIFERGISISIGFYIIGLLVYLIPSILGYLAYKKSINTPFATIDGLHLGINTLLLGLLIYLSVDYK